MAGYEIAAVTAVHCPFVQAPWAFAESHADEIRANWLLRQREKPELFDGRVLVLRDGHIDGAALTGSFIETDFSAFLFWRQQGFPPAGVRNCFAMAAIESADGAFILGEMAPHTAPAGQIYFPSGTPDQNDVFAGRVDLHGSAIRELREETGLEAGDVEVASELVLVSNATRICCMKPVRSPDSAEALVARIHSWLALDPQPELARMHVVRSMDDVRPAMPDFVVAYLAHMFARR